MCANILELRGVTKVFKTGLTGKPVVAVDKVSFALREGEILSLLGESGSGKSTIARMILRFLKPTQGSIIYRGKDVWRLQGREVLEYYQEVQGIFQDPYSSFNPIHRVEHHLKQALRSLADGKKNFDEDNVIREAMERVGLNPQNVMGKYPHELSGGQLQRLSIARALLARPRLLVADEPVSMLDASTRVDLLNILAELRDEERMTIILIGHDLSLAYYISDTVVVLYRGSVMESGHVDEVLMRPKHPYTRLLLDSVPQLDKKWEHRMGLENGDQDYDELSKGCKFAPRCPKRFDKCEETPPLLTLGSRRVSCWLYADRQS